MVDEDKNFTPAAESDSAPSDNGNSVAAKPVKNNKRGMGAWLGYGVLLLVLLLAGAGIFLLSELRSKQEGLGSGLDKGDKQMQELLHQISSLQTELAAVHSQLATVQSQVTTEESKFEREISDEGSSLTEKVEAVRTDLGGSIQHIQRQLNQTRGDVMVADAEYLLSVANQKLHLVGDVKAVLAMMEAADQRLHDSGDPAAFKVRDALAEEINQLKGFTPPDVVGISSKLLALEAKSKELPLFLPHSERASEDRRVKASPVEPKPTGTGAGIIKDLKDLVTVRHTDKSVEAILDPEHAVALRQVLLLKLEMSRAALLRGDDELYKTNMDTALAWLQEHFDPDAAATQSFITEFKSLQGLQLQVPFPDISKSLSMLRNIEKLRVEAEKGKPLKQDKPAPKTDKPAEAQTVGPAPAAPQAAPLSNGGANLPIAEPIPDEGAKP